MKTIQRWNEFDLGPAAVLRIGTIAWHVNKVLTMPTTSVSTALLNNMENGNIIKPTGSEKYVLIRRTPARVRDVTRLSTTMGICIQLLLREQEDFGFDSKLECSWKNFDKLVEVQSVLDSIQVVR
jgi:hypothetical protein